ASRTRIGPASINGRRNLWRKGRRRTRTGARPSSGPRNAPIVDASLSAEVVNDGLRQATTPPRHVVLVGPYRRYRGSPPPTAARDPKDCHVPGAGVRSTAFRRL